MLTDRASFAALASCVAIAVLGPVVAARAVPDPGAPAAGPAADVVTTLRDPGIVEASALVSRPKAPRRAYVVNDKGNAPVVYRVDLDTGETTGTVRLTGVEVVDPEAMAAGVRGTLWVGDIGDNGDTQRSTITLYEVPYPGLGDESARLEGVDLRYPDGAHDAEALLLDRTSGTRWIVTKQDGRVYRVPAAAGTSGTTELVRVTGVSRPTTITDGVVLAGGRGVVLRGYGSATVYDLPGWDRVGAFDLPAQPQGEAITQRGTGRTLLVTHEGVYPEVARTLVPRTIWRRLG